MTPRPRASTRFPYTTLFRSSPGALDPAAHPAARPPRPGAEPGRPARRHRGARVPAMKIAAVAERARDIVATLDRKSTRLNSSHLGISYAVFCLKKKTIAELH